MQFIYEASAFIDSSPASIRTDWSDGTFLPRILTHIRATAIGDADDLLRIVALIDGAHVEFVAQRTMCDNGSVCWQNLEDDFYYVLSVGIAPHNNGVNVTITVSYDPPGILPDIMETLCLGRGFKNQLEADMKRYADSFRSSAFAPALSLAE